MQDFTSLAENLPPETFAKIRGLYIPGGIEDEDPEKIMDTPTPLDGKRILIVDEVSRTGSTKAIAEYLVSRAFPGAEVSSIDFWQSHTVSDRFNNQEMSSAPVWYDSKSSLGRGIGQKDPAFFERQYEENPTPENRAKKFGAMLLGKPINLELEPERRSLRLQEEMKRMHEEYQAGHILMPFPRRYSQDKWLDSIQAHGIKLVPPEPGKRPPKNSLLGVLESIKDKR